MKLSDKIEVCAEQIENCIEIGCLDSKQLRLILGQFAESVNENCNLHIVMAMLPTNEEIQFHIEKHTRHNNGEAAMDEQTFYEGAKWLKAEFCRRVEGN